MTAWKQRLMPQQQQILESLHEKRLPDKQMARLLTMVALNSKELELHHHHR